MVAIKYDYSDVDDSQTSYAGEEPTPGIYPAKVMDVKVEKSQAGNQMLHVRLQITSGEYKGWIGHHYLVQNEESLWKTKEFTDALGISKPGKKSGSWRTEQAEGKPCRIKTKREMYEGEPRAKVRSVLTFKTADETDDETDVAADVANEPAATDEPEPYTWEEISALGRNDLKAIIKDEELSVVVKRTDSDEDLAVKVAEALGISTDSEEEESDEEGDDEESSDDEEPWAMEDIADLDLAGLKKFIKEEALEVRVGRRETADTLRAKVATALGIEDSDDNAEEPF